MKQSDVTKWLISEATTVLSNSSLVTLSTPAEHVDVAEAGMDHPYPFVGIQKLATPPESAGLGNGELFVDSETYQNGILQQRTYRRDSTLAVDVIPVTDGDKALRDDLGDELADHFNLLARQGNTPDDIGDTSVGEFSPTGRPADLVAADGISIDVPFSRYIVDSDPDVADTVNVDIDVADDPDNVGTDGFDESF